MKLKYCVECAAPYKTKDRIRYDCDNGHSYWNNARTAVAVILVQGNKILFAKRGREPRKGTYDLPGGFVDLEESVEQAAKREMLEETGLIIDDLHILTSYPAEYVENVYVCDMIVWAKIWSGDLRAQDDVAELEWHTLGFIDSELFSASYPPDFKTFLEKSLN